MQTINTEATRGGSARPGFALVTVIIMITVLSVLLAAFSTLTQHEIASVRATADGATGFYSAEAGLNIRGEQVRSIFQGYARPSGDSPDSEDACTSGNEGSGDFDCRTFTFNNRSITTYIVEDPRNNDPDDSERMITIPTGERFAGLNAIQYRYSVLSEAVPPNEDRPEAILEMVFRTRLVPLFQFAAFYDKDLEVLPGADMTLGGPVHVNGDLYMHGTGATVLSVTGAVTVGRNSDGGGGEFWRGRKDTNACEGTLLVNDASSTPKAVPCPRRSVPQTELDTWGGRIETGMERLTVPSAEEFAPGGRYWHEADIVVALDMRSANVNDRGIIVPNRDFTGGINNITANTTLTNLLNSCASDAYATRSYADATTAHATGVPGIRALTTPRRAVEYSNRFRDKREDGNTGNQRYSYRVMVEVDVAHLMRCLDDNADLFNDGNSTERNLTDTSDGGLVWYFTVLGPHSTDTRSGYGVRLRNGSFLGVNTAWANQIKGLTVVSDHAVFVQGNYNLGGANWRPAAILTDALNILSEDFRNTWNGHAQGSALRVATNTEVQAAFMGGTHTTGGIEGTAGQGGAYNGGLENYPILHENWGGRTLRYLGSFVSLERPKHSSGVWIYGDPYYTAPVRNWGYDTRFNNAENLPPLAPRFVYLLQERFVREFNR